jgi:RecJ-like exonuclease
MIEIIHQIKEAASGFRSRSMGLGLALIALDLGYFSLKFNYPLGTGTGKVEHCIETY